VITIGVPISAQIVRQSTDRCCMALQIGRACGRNGRSQAVDLMMAPQLSTIFAARVMCAAEPAHADHACLLTRPPEGL